MSEEEPRGSKGDVAHAVVKAGLSAIPVVGGPLVELFQLLVQPPLEGRRAKWMSRIGERLLELEARGFDLGSLRENEQFLSAVMQATSAALRTHQEEKLKALRNAVFNIALGKGPEEALQHLLLSFIDDMTELHLRLLMFARNPNPPTNIMSSGLSHVLEQRIPTLQGQRFLYDQIWRDLYTKGLVNVESLHTPMTLGGLAQERTTQLGEALLALVAE